MERRGLTRRAAVMGAGVAAAWLASPARALLAATGAPSARVARLVAAMTPEEKAGQLTIMSAAWAGGRAVSLNPASTNGSFDGQVADAVAGRLTGVFNGNGAAMALAMQRAVMAGSRLKVPLLFAADVIHGHRTIFPVPVAEAASFDPELARRTARVAATEAAGAGLDWTFFPMVDIARDQRWGRTMEGAGEDVRLGELFAAARVHGFQGDRGLAADDAVMACVKHFAAYGGAEAGLDYNSVDLSDRTLKEVYLPPYKAGLDAGALSIMTSFNELAGVPSTGNRWLLTDLLRDQWGFRGIVVSDYTSDEEMIAAGYAADRRDAARLAFLAGCDMSMESGVYREHLPGLVRDGVVPMAMLDRSVARVLAVKEALGLFDDPFRRIDVKREGARSRLPASLALAREAGRRSIVMLRNDGDLLPLPTAGRRIALIGPFGAGQHDLNGPWVVYGDNAQAVDLATGIRAQLADPAALTVVAGSGVDQPLAGGIEAAVAAARAADVVLLAIGESENMSGEAQSRTEITVPAAQMALAEAVAATGKPVVAIIKNGRALALAGAVKAAPAILVTWFLGSETGHAIADILFGREGPSGRLPVSWPIESGQEPYHYDHKITGRPAPPGPRQPYKAQYRSVPNEALFPFGHGLTYGRIDYADLALPGTLASGATLAVTARVTNRGAHAATELVQLYIHDRVASITQPIRRLVAFQHVALQPGESRTVRFTLARADLLFVGPDLQPTVEPGWFDLWVAPSAAAEGLHGQFELTA